MTGDSIPPNPPQDPYVPQPQPLSSSSDRPYWTGPVPERPAAEPVYAAPRVERGPQRGGVAPMERKPDPGSGTMAVIAGVLVVVLLAATAFLQQAAVNARAPQAPAQTASTPVVPPEMDQLYLMSRALTKIAALGPQNPQTAAYAAQLDTLVQTEADRVRLVTVIGFLEDDAAALKRLDELEAAPGDEGSDEALQAAKKPRAQRPLAADSTLRKDTALLRKIYEQGVSNMAIDVEGEKYLIARHGFYGELAMLEGTVPGDQRREQLVGGGLALGLVLLGVVLVAVAAFVAGLVMGLVALVKASSGTLQTRFVPPAPGGSVPLEMVAVFIGSFIMLKVVLELLATLGGFDKETMQWLALSLQWVLALVIFYPVLRGMSRAGSRQMLGLHTGRGVLREIGCGICAYLAFLPVYVVSAIIALGILIISQAMRKHAGLEEEMPANPLADLVSNASVWKMLLLALLTTVWAPLVEETVFRGALFRQLRGWLHWSVAAIASGLVFALMHQYHLAQLVPVFTLGFAFALVREWRGSLIASMTCHFIHNGFITLILFTVISMLR